MPLDSFCTCIVYFSGHAVTVLGTCSDSFYNLLDILSVLLPMVMKLRLQSLRIFI